METVQDTTQDTTRSAAATLTLHDDPPARPTLAPLWVLAALPLVVALLVRTGMSPEAVGGLLSAMTAVTTGAVLASERAFRAAGLPARLLVVVLGVLLTPVHLVSAVRRDRRALRPAVAWVVSGIASLVVAAGTPTTYSAPVAHLESRLAGDVAQVVQVAPGSVEVDCPGSGTLTWVAGDTVTCRLVDGGAGAAVEVRFDDAGGYAWQVVPTSPS